MSEFKVGDRVKIKSKWYPSDTIGTIIAVFEIVESMATVKLDKPIIDICDVREDITICTKFLNILNENILNECTCDIMVLMSQGCKCGTFQREKNSKKEIQML